MCCLSSYVMYIGVWVWMVWHGPKSVRRESIVLGKRPLPAWPLVSVSLSVRSHGCFRTGRTGTLAPEKHSCIQLERMGGKQSRRTDTQPTPHPTHRFALPDLYWRDVPRRAAVSIIAQHGAWRESLARPETRYHHFPYIANDANSSKLLPNDRVLSRAGISALGS